MRRLNLVFACALASLLIGDATASAQNTSATTTRDTYFTFSQPVMVPNETLPAGRYLFRVIGDGKNIVQIYSGDRARLITTAMSVHAARSDMPERPEIRLIESSSDAPVAIGTWWYPEMRQGWEFIYPRAQATKLAKTARQPILTTAQDVPGDRVSSSDLVRLEPTGAQSDYQAANTPAPVRGTAQVGEVADADANANRVAAAMTGSSTMARAGDTPSSTSRTTLPRTASNTPAVVVVSVLACMAGLALGFRRRRA